MADPATFDADFVSKELNAHELEPTVTLGLPESAHMPAHPKEAREFLFAALEKVEAIGSKFLGGVIYAHVGTITGKPPTQQELSVCADVLREVAQEAKRRGVTIAIEPGNRYETYLVNCVEDAVSLVEAVGAENLKIHLDTYHMNIEEHGFFAPTKLADKNLAYIHASESDRGVVGDGNVRWADFFRALGEIRYSGPLILESFSSTVPELARATCLWRKSKVSISDMVRRGIEFLRAEALAADLP
jgi:D-psicose/D-tagatose/L-ribulose 3-epimerase